MAQNADRKTTPAQSFFMLALAAGLYGLMLLMRSGGEDGTWATIRRFFLDTLGLRADVQELAEFSPFLAGLLVAGFGCALLIGVFGLLGWIADLFGPHPVPFAIAAGRTLENAAVTGLWFGTVIGSLLASAGNPLGMALGFCLPTLLLGLWYKRRERPARHGA